MRIEKNSQVIGNLEKELNNAKIELQTDRELLKRHQDVIQKEKKMTETLKQKVQSNGQVNLDLAKKEK